MTLALTGHAVGRGIAIGRSHLAEGSELEIGEYRRHLAAAGFEQVSIEVTRVHERPELAGRFDGRLVSAFVRARKPAAA